LFAILVLAALYGCARVARAFRLAPVLRPVEVARRREGQGAVAPSISASRAGEAERSRAAAVANMLMAADRRERLGSPMALAGPGGSARVPAVRSSDEQRLAPVPVGRSFTRRPHARASASAAKRDMSE
jgi:hypothetical protein